MVRIVIGIVIVAGVIALTSLWLRQDRQMRVKQEQQISDLENQVSSLKSENNRLKEELGKIQEEEGKLASSNELLRKALEQAKLTGKVPALPYPPK